MCVLSTYYEGSMYVNQFLFCLNTYIHYPLNRYYSNQKRTRGRTCMWWLSAHDWLTTGLRLGHGWIFVLRLGLRLGPRLGLRLGFAFSDSYKSTRTQDRKICINALERIYLYTGTGGIPIVEEGRLEWWQCIWCMCVSWHGVWWWRWGNNVFTRDGGKNDGDRM